MAVAAIVNKSSGIYYREIDLTIVTQAVGTFAGGMLGLTEKGPAFQVMASSTFSERIARLGNLNPLYPSSYYAREFLAQANNYKEVRILGLEGYNETVSEGGTDKAFAVQYAVTGASTRTPIGVGPFTAPVIAALESVAAVLKPRRTTFTQYAAVDYITIGTILQRDGVTVAATDDVFALTINYVSPTLNPPLTLPCSLRPAAKEYIGSVFGEDPRDNTKVQSRTSPLWVQYVYDSNVRKTTAGGTLNYSYPGTTAPLTFLNILQGDITIETGFSFPTTTLTSTTLGNPTVAAVAATTLPATIVAGTAIRFAGTGIAVTNNVNILSLDGPTFYAGPVIVAGTSVTVYFDAALTLPVATSGVFAGGTIQQVFLPTWETEVMTLGGSLVTEQIPFQTPITPWFVADGDHAGNTQRIFRIWSISDGHAANVEIKLEIANINPDGNLGFGSFDILVRIFNDRDDQQRQVVEAFTNLTMNPKSINWINRRLGDGETFPLQSRYIFVEINSTDQIDPISLPYGIEGYVDTTGLVFPDVIWTPEYDFNKSLTKQYLGLPNNQINMFAPLVPEALSFKNVQNLAGATGKGFHLNPTNNLNISTAKFVLANQTIYQVNPPTNINVIAGSEKVKRSKYVVAFAGGFDAFNVYNERSWADQTSADYLALTEGLAIFADNESLETDFSVLVTPDFNFEDHAPASEATLEMVTQRGDALYLPDFRYDIDAVPENAALSISSSQMNSSFVAVYYPHVQISDDVNNTNLWLAPSIIALATIAATATNEQVWQPPAGSLRTVTDNLVRVRRRMQLADREILKTASINPITLFPGSGFEITESRTTQPFLSALSFVHNRLLLGYAKKALSQTLRPLLQQLNSVNLQNSFINTVTPIFDRIKKLNGLDTFKVSIDTSNPDKTTLNGIIEIVPLYPVERIIVDFKMENGTLNFNQ
jgi:hypothetical protein